MTSYRKYPRVKDGDVIFPDMDGYKMACCDCGLVHRVDFEVVKQKLNLPTGEFLYKPVRGYRVSMKVARDNRATAAMRREDAKRRG